MIWHPYLLWLKAGWAIQPAFPFAAMKVNKSFMVGRDVD